MYSTSGPALCTTQRYTLEIISTVFIRVFRFKNTVAFDRILVVLCSDSRLEYGLYL